MSIRIASITLGLAVVLALGACSGSPTEPAETSTPPEVQTTIETPSEAPEPAVVPVPGDLEAQLACLDEFFWSDDQSLNALMCEAYISPSYSNSDTIIWVDNINGMFGDGGEMAPYIEDPIEWVEITPEAASIWLAKRCG